METVKVACPVVEGNPNGFYVINAEDFDAKIHTPFAEAKIKAKTKAELAAEKKAQEEADAVEAARVAAEEKAKAEAVQGWGATPPA